MQMRSLLKANENMAQNQLESKKKFTNKLNRYACQSITLSLTYGNRTGRAINKFNKLRKM